MPCLQGALVSKKTPSTAITEEYAKADPVYVQKTSVGKYLLRLPFGLRH